MQIMRKNMKSVNLLFQVFPPEDCLQLMQTGQRLLTSLLCYKVDQILDRARDLPQVSYFIIVLSYLLV